ncbi:MAG: hypothetical protein U0401_33835 [Anaerolineae bacterium]
MPGQIDCSGRFGSAGRNAGNTLLVSQSSQAVAQAARFWVSGPGDFAQSLHEGAGIGFIR